MENRKVLELWPMFGPGSEDFPEAAEMPEGTISVSWPERTGLGMVDVKANLVYQRLR